MQYQQVDDQIEKTIAVGFNQNAELSSVLIEIKRNKNDDETEGQRKLRYESFVSETKALGLR